MATKPHFSLCLLFLIISLIPVVVEADAPSLEGLPILSLEVASKIGMTIETLSRLTGIRTGIPYSARVIRESLDSLYATGLFTDVLIELEPVEGGVAVVYQLTERTMVGDLEIKGNHVFWNRTLAGVMAIQIGEEFTEEKWKSSMNRLIRFLHRKGYLQAKVRSEISAAPRTNQVMITVHVSEGSRTKIRKIRFPGHPVYSDFRLWSLTRSKPGEFYSSELLDKDLDRLKKLYQRNGYLKAIIGPAEIRDHPDTNEVDIAIPIQAETRLKIQFDGTPLFPEIQLAPVPLFQEEKSYNEDVFRASVDRLTDFYYSKGYSFAQITYSRIELPESDELLAVFNILPGKRACLTSVRFSGNSFFTDRQLHQQIKTGPGGTFSCGLVDRNILKTDLKTVRTRYLEQGFLEMAVKSNLEYNDEKTKTDLTLVIEEGPRTLIKEVRIEGNQALASELLESVITLRPGMPYDTIPVRNNMNELLALYHRHGYIYSKITPKEDFSEDRSRVSILYQIEEDYQVTVGRILLTGNTFTADKVILRELEIRTGDPYDETRVLISARKIRRLGYLGNVRFEPITSLSREPKQYITDMRLTVQERPTKTLDIGIGYADVEHLRGFIEGTHRNLGGAGRSLSLRAEGSEIERNYSATYREPWILGYPVDGRLVAFDQIQVRDTFRLITVGGLAGLEKNFSSSVKASLQYQFENNRYTDFEPATTLQREDQRANIASLNPALFWDTRDDPFNPTSGFLHGLTFRDAALILGSQVQMLKATVRSSWYIPITPWMVLALSTRGGLADRFGETAKISLFGDPTDLVPPNERFYLGGRSTVRGYQQDQLGIVGNNGTISVDTGEATGGNAMLLFNGEIRLFLPGGLGMVFFNDRGNVFRGHQDIDLALLKSTIGAGLWIGTPVGPIRLDYGYKLNREKNLCPNCIDPIVESAAELHFTLGFAF